MPSQLPPINEQADNSKLIIIIDELDRCRPTFAIELLEKIKHLFSVQNIVFVLVMNKQQLEQSIRYTYGDIDAHTYLQKFITFGFQLPRLTKSHGIYDYHDYTKKLLTDHGLDTLIKNEPYCLHAISTLASHFNISLRQLQKVIVGLVFFYASLQEYPRNIFPLIAYIAFIKVVYPKIFQALVNNEPNSLSELARSLTISRKEENIDNDILKVFKQWLSFVSMDRQEYAELPPNDPIKKYEEAFLNFNMNRENVITEIVKRFYIFGIGDFT